MSQQWQAERYDSQVGFVSKLGRGVLDLLQPQAGEHILDLGCGTGHLSQQIAESGSFVTGVDSSPEMILRARELFPSLTFDVQRGEALTVPGPFDAVFSNAALHWMTRPAAVIESVRRVLTPGGRFVAEMGGKGNVQTVVSALRDAMLAGGLPPEAFPAPWYFPSIAEYAGLLEAAGFEVLFMELFDRPTPLDHGGDLSDWIQIFCGAFLAAAPEAQRPQIVAATVEACRHALLSKNGWFVDYRRLRFLARRGS